MKIVYLFHSIATHGGLERVLVDKINYLADNTNSNIYIITSDQKGNSLSYILSKKVHLIDLGGIKYFSIYQYKYPLRFIYLYKFNHDYKKRLKKIINEIEPDIIIGNTTFNTTLIANINTNAKKIVESHLAKEFIMKAGKEHQNINPIEFVLKSIYDWHMCRTINKFDKLVLLTKRDYYQWKKIKNKTIISNPITLYPENTYTTNSKTIICAVRLYREKGLDLLIKAWSIVSPKYTDWKINVYGDGYLRDELINLAKKYNVSTTFIINKSINNIYNKYFESEFLVLSSRAEGFGLALAEAMSCGRPCVSFNCPCGPDEIITDGVDGLLAKNGDVDDLAEKIEWMITHNKERKEMGIRARESAKRYDKEKIMTQWIDLFNELTNNTNV